MQKMIDLFKRSVLISISMVVATGAMLFGTPASAHGGDKKDAFNGYTLVAPLNNQDVRLVDNQGKEVHAWKTNTYSGVVTKLLHDGSLLRSYTTDNPNFRMGGTGGGIQLLRWDGSVYWDFRHSSDAFVQHHDAEVLPNGNILTLVWVKVPEDKAIAAGVDPANLDPITRSTWSEQIIEINRQTKQIVWQWDVFDHLVQEYDAQKPHYGKIADHPSRVDANYYKYAKKPDWLHANSLSYNPKTDQIVVSAREFNEFWVIDHSTTTALAAASNGGRSGKGGDLLYRYGNPEAYGHGTATNRTLFLQHDVSWIPKGLKGAGNILLFNNGDANAGRAYSGVLELSLPHTGATFAQNHDGSFKEPKIAWRYEPTGADQFFSNIMGGAQRLPNGNTLITDAAHGRGIEVTRAGNKVWEYTNPIYDTNRFNPTGPKTNNVFRMYKYSAYSPIFYWHGIVPSRL